jgi:tetratricopeptide (TPR) repeat protein
MTDAVLRKFVVAGLLAGIGVLNGCTYWNGELERICDQSERDFRRDLVGPFSNVDLKTVLDAPTGFKYEHVRFDAILNHVGEKGYIPYYTIFDPENYTAFSAWPAGAKLWESDDRAHSHPLFFIQRQNPSVYELYAAGRFSLVRISATVMSDYELKPWFAVNRIEVLEPNIYTEDALVDLSMAKDAMAAKKPAVAIKHYENALLGVWTTSLRLEIHLTLARLYEGRGDLESALKHFRGALSNDQDNAEALKGVERIQKALEAKGAPPAPAPQ